MQEKNLIVQTQFDEAQGRIEVSRTRTMKMEQNEVVATEDR